jgi:tetratricopeptide (TPR) repeat protein
MTYQPPPPTHQQQQYPPQLYYAPPPQRGGGDRWVAVVLAIVLVGGALVAGGIALSRAFRNYEGQNGMRKGDEMFAQAAKLYQQGNYLEAAKLFGQVRVSSSSSGETARKATDGELYCYRQLAHQAQDRKDYTEAERWYQAALVVSPGDTQTRTELEAIQRVRISESAPAATPPPPVASQVTTQFPSSPAAGTPNLRASDFVNTNARLAQEAMNYYNQAEAYAQRGKIGEAIRLWSKAVAANPGSPAGMAAQRRITEYNRQNNPLDFSN